MEQDRNNPKDTAVHLFQILDMVEVVTTIPTHHPTTLFGQFKLYTDSLSSPTVYRLFVYFPKLNVWKSIEFTDGPSASVSLSPSRSPSISPSASPS